MTDQPTPRLAKLAVADLDSRQRRLYDAIVEGPRATGPQAFALTDADGGLEGPFNAMLLSPHLGEALQALGAAIRYGANFTDREREIAILVVAAAWDCAFERYAHEALGRLVGLTDLELAGLRRGDLRCLSDERERAIATICRALAQAGNLDDQAFATGMAVFGGELMFQLTTLVGYYATLALQLRVFGVALPDQAA